MLYFLSDFQKYYTSRSVPRVLFHCTLGVLDSRTYTVKVVPYNFRNRGAEYIQNNNLTTILLDVTLCSVL
jgi:hypothetical protein